MQRQMIVPYGDIIMGSILCILYGYNVCVCVLVYSFEITGWYRSILNTVLDT